MVHPLATIVSLLLSGLLAASGGEDRGETGGKGGAPLQLVGRWVLDSSGKPVPSSSFRRGLQPSALLVRGGELWSIGDQRSQWPGHVLRIDPATGWMIGGPIEIELPASAGANELFHDYRSIPNSDFEGLAAHPKDPSVLYAVTEDKRQWVVKIHLEGLSPPRPIIEEITPLKFPVGLKASGGDDPNYRVEGITLSDDGETMYLAWERAADNLPRIFSLSTRAAGSGQLATVEEVPVDFSSLPVRADKARARLNLNDIQFLRHRGRALILAIARDQERILVIDLERGQVERFVDLDFRDPDGDSMLWVSPEGLAADGKNDRLWIINDPDSIRGNYRKLKNPSAQGHFAAMAPLLFTMKLSDLVPDSAGSGDSTGATTR